MISSSDSQNTIELNKFYLILPNLNKKILNNYKKKFKCKKVNKNFIYNSNTNKKFLSINELRKMINNLSIQN